MATNYDKELNSAITVLAEAIRHLAKANNMEYCSEFKYRIDNAEDLMKRGLATIKSMKN